MFEGTPEKKMVPPINALRRGLNYVELIEEDTSNQYDDFFDFEKDLSEEDIPPPSRMLAAKATGAEMFMEKDELPKEEPPIGNEGTGLGFLVMEDQHGKEEGETLIFMEEVPDELEKTERAMELDKNDASEFMTDEELNDFIEEVEAEKKPEVKFTFIQCEFIKKDGNRCKKQAPKGYTICSTHRRMLKKRGL